jgi:hypothetical protein
VNTDKVWGVLMMQGQSTDKDEPRLFSSEFDQNFINAKVDFIETQLKG